VKIRGGGEEKIDERGGGVKIKRRKRTNIFSPHPLRYFLLHYIYICQNPTTKKVLGRYINICIHIYI